MTAATAVIASPHRARGAHHEVPRIWGLDARQLHDRYWAAHGVQVVRRGESHVAVNGPRMHLLLEPPELVLFDLAKVARYLPRCRLGALRVRVIEREEEDYSERIIEDESNRLIALRRKYAPPARSELPVVVTSDAAIALLWRNSRTRRAGWRAIRLAAGLKGHRQTSCWGRMFDAGDPAQARQCMLLLTRCWRDVNAACEGAVEHQDHVWAHPSATIDSGVRFVPPVWIGAGVALRSGDVVVGPFIVDDDSSLKRPESPRAWPSLRAPCLPSMTGPPIDRPQRMGKRLFDIVFSVTALLAIVPLAPLITLAIWLEDGRPVLFSQRRQTVGGRNFICFKFRTMCRHAERAKRQLACRNVCDGPQFHIANDPRLLRVGRFLRRFHLDELPQFLNVLFGDMSVVGPRPSPDAENQFYPAWREARLSVRPGLTGLWQVRCTRRANTDFQEWIRYDLEYLQRQSWLLDLWIIAKTPLAMLIKPDRRARLRGGAIG